MATPPPEQGEGEEGEAKDCMIEDVLSPESRSLPGRLHRSDPVPGGGQGGSPNPPSPYSSRTRTFCNVRRPRRRVGRGGGGGGGGAAGCCWVLLLLRSTLLFLYH
ncbi:unnamed protein product [Boreogadus saida]